MLSNLYNYLNTLIDDSSHWYFNWNYSFFYILSFIACCVIVFLPIALIIRAIRRFYD